MKVEIDGDEYVRKDKKKSNKSVTGGYVNLKKRSFNLSCEKDEGSTLDDVQKRFTSYRQLITLAGKEFVIGYDKTNDEVDVFWEEE